MGGWEVVRVGKRHGVADVGQDCKPRLVMEWCEGKRDEMGGREEERRKERGRVH